MRRLTNSEMGRFRVCQRKHRIEYPPEPPFYRPAKAGQALNFGLHAHRSLEAFWVSAREFQGSGGSLKTTDGPLTAAISALDEIPTDQISDFEKVELLELLLVYDESWKPDIDLFEVLEVELSFERSLVNPKTWRSSRTFSLAGKIDGILRELETGRILLLEHKTTSKDISPGAPYWKRLEMDPQLSGYVLGAEGAGYRIDAALYDVIRRPGLRDLKKPETVDERRARIRAKIDEDRGAYSIVREVPRLNGQIEDYMRDTWETADAIRRNELRPASEIPRNPDACFLWGACPYFDHCVLAVPLSELDGVIETNERHQELVDDRRPETPKEPF